MMRAARALAKRYIDAGRPLQPFTRWIRDPMRWYYHRSRVLKHDVSGALRARLLVQLHRVMVGDHPHDFAIYGDRLTYRSSGNAMAIHGYYVGEIEYHLSAFLVCQIRPGFVMLDVGAHHGVHSLVVAHELAQRGIAGHVHSFEPDPHNVSLLRHNVAHNGLDPWVTVHPVAVGDRDGSEELLISSDDNSSHTFSENQDYALADTPSQATTVQSVALDSLSLSRVDLIKIDVQGAEPRVLTGAERLIERLRPTVVVEAVPGWPSTRATENFLERHGYRIQGLRADGSLCERDSDDAFVSWDWVGVAA